MKRYKIIGMVVISMVLLSISSLAAEGIQERQEPAAPGYGARFDYSTERVEVTGTVELTAAGIVLKGDKGDEYKLMYPRYLAEDVQIKSGDSISVEGFLVPGPRWGQDENEKHLRVEQASIDGEEYDLSRIGYAQGMWAGRSRMSGGQVTPGYAPRGGAYGPGAAQTRQNYSAGRGPGRMGGPAYCW